MIHDWRARLAGVLASALGLGLVLPAAVAAHSVNATYASRLPLAVYLVGAAATVALSFAFAPGRGLVARTILQRRSNRRFRLGAGG